MRKSIIYTGFTLIAASATLFSGSLFGLAPGLSLRTIASVAVAGCLLIAIGYWEQ